VQVDALGSGTFTTREGDQKPFTKKIEVNYVQGQKQPVKVEWTQNSKFLTGGYKVEIYNNGFKIGEGVVTLKKVFFYYLSSLTNAKTISVNKTLFTFDKLIAINAERKHSKTVGEICR